MKIKIIKSGSGLKAGEVKDVPNHLGMSAVNSGIAEEVVSSKKEAKVNVTTKEQKTVDKKTKSKK